MIENVWDILYSLSSFWRDTKYVSIFFFLIEGTGIKRHIGMFDTTFLSLLYQITPPNPDLQTMPVRLEGGSRES